MLRTVLKSWEKHPAIIRPLTFYLSNYLSKIKGKIELIVDSITWTRQYWPTSKHLFISALNGHWMDNRDGWREKV